MGKYDPEKEKGGKWSKKLKNSLFCQQNLVQTIFHAQTTSSQQLQE